MLKKPKKKLAMIGWGVFTADGDLECVCLTRDSARSAKLDGERIARLWIEQ